VCSTSSFVTAVQRQKEETQRHSRYLVVPSRDRKHELLESCMKRLSLLSLSEFTQGCPVTRFVVCYGTAL
jgi:hypothetical protein